MGNDISNHNLYSGFLHSSNSNDDPKEVFGPACRDYFWNLCRLVDNLGQVNAQIAVDEEYVNDPNDDQTVNPAVLVGENDNFGTNASASEISSLSTSLYGWPVIETSEAALLIDLDPGYYSAQLQSTSAANDGNGWIGIDDVTSN